MAGELLPYPGKRTIIDLQPNFLETDITPPMKNQPAGHRGWPEKFVLKFPTRHSIIGKMNLTRSAKKKRLKDIE
jgi:hypothetical protein